MIISGELLKLLRGRSQRVIEPFVDRTQHECGMSYGVGPAGYDVRIDQDLIMYRGSFSLASTMEEFDMPDNLQAYVHDKSTYARLGLQAFNTVIDPGWRGFLTLELTYFGDKPLMIKKGSPIVQIIFHRVEGAVKPYTGGKYDNQERGPVPARFSTPSLTKA